MYLIPETFQSQHEISVYFHNQIVHLLKRAWEEKAFHHRIRFRNEADANAFHASGDPVGWLHASPYSAEADATFKVGLLPALGADFCNFIYESLSCSERGKMTNCFYQLRRPLKDTLFVLEWLLADPDDYIAKMRFDPPSEYAVDRVSPDRKREIIAGAAAKIRMQFADPDFLYDLRFNKRIPFGFEPLFQKAVHLVTEHPAYATERQNLNFIFSKPEDKQDQWDGLYRVMPYLLYYALEVIEALLEPYGVARTESQRIEGDLNFAFYRKTVEEAQAWVHEHGFEEVVTVT